MPSKRVGFVALAGALAAGACDPAVADNAKRDKDTKAKIDPKADGLMHQMSTSLANTKSFAFDADHVLEVVTKDGERLQFVAKSHLSVERPNKARSDRVGPIADATLYYDGSDLTISGNRAGLYATAPAPGTLDAAIDFARDKLGLEAPASDLLYSDVYGGLMDGVESGMYIGNEPVGDRMCHHLAFRAKETDWQIWIEDTPRAFPCRYVITSKTVKGEPTFEVSLGDWKVPSGVEASQYVFKPSPSSTKIEFLALKARTMKGKKP